MNLDSFKSSIITNNLGEHPSKTHTSYVLDIASPLNKKSPKKIFVPQLFHQAINN